MTLVRMCDEALDTSNDALLSRIAQLEEKLLTGVVIKPSESKPAPKQEKPLENSIPKEKLEMPRVPSKPLNDAGRRVLRPIQSWMEVVERIMRSDPMEASFVKNSRAYTTEDGAVIVRFDSDFSMQMMQRDDSRDRLRAAISAVLRREVGDRMLTMEVLGKAAEASVIDEIIDASEEH